MANNIVTIIKEKKGKATVIEFEGERYALVHTDYINGNKNKVKGKNSNGNGKHT